MVLMRAIRRGTRHSLDGSKTSQKLIVRSLKRQDAGRIRNREKRSAVRKQVDYIYHPIVNRPNKF